MMDNQILSPKARSFKDKTLYTNDTAESYGENEQNTILDKKMLKARIETLKSQIVLLKKLQDEQHMSKIQEKGNEIVANMVYVKNNVLLKRHWLKDQLDQSKLLKTDKMQKIEIMERKIENNTIIFDNAMKKKGIDRNMQKLSAKELRINLRNNYGNASNTKVNEGILN